MTIRAILRAVLVGSLMPGLASAQMTDPTRPAGAALGSELSGAYGAPAESGVQTVIVRRDGKSAAVINGRYVIVGDRLDDKRVIKISESEIVLKGAGGREVIKVTPSIEKQPVRRPAGAKSSTKGTMEGTSAK